MSQQLHEILEKEWQRTVVQLARTLGYLTYHTFDSRRSDTGFPDLVLVKNRVIFLELKRELHRGRNQGLTTTKQIDWLVALNAAGAEAYLARPRHLDQVGSILGPRDTQRWHEARGVLLQELDELTAKEAA